MLKPKISMIFLFKRKAVYFFSFLFFVFTTGFTQAQLDITGISTVWDDAFHEWHVYAFNQQDEEVQGTLRVKWQFRQDAWKEWVFELENYDAQIRQKYTNELNHWELRSNEGTIDFKLQWRNDVNQWQINWNRERIKWRTKFNNDLNDWIYKGENDDLFSVYTIYRDDPRDWEVYYENIDLPMDVQVAMIFISIYYSTPK